MCFREHHQLCVMSLISYGRYSTHITLYRIIRHTFIHICYAFVYKTFSSFQNDCHLHFLFRTLCNKRSSLDCYRDDRAIFPVEWLTSCKNKKQNKTKHRRNWDKASDVRTVNLTQYMLEY